ncbi:MAG: tyrosine-type recombinase/integrase [Eubacteriales bacterium]
MNGIIKDRVLKKGTDNNGRLKENLKVYDVYYRYKNPSSGVWKQTSKKGFRTKGEAQKYLLKINNELHNNTFVQTTKLTLREYLRSWYDEYVVENLKSNTTAGYKVNIECHIIPHLGNVELQSLTTQHIEELYRFLLKEGRSDCKGGLSPMSVIYVHRVLTKALSMAQRQLFINHNPAETAIPPKTRQKKLTIYGREEILNLFDCTLDTDMEVPIALAALCGLRRGEILALTYDDIDLEGKTIDISKQLVPIKKGVIIDTPKSEDSHRVIAIPDIVVEMILRSKERQEMHRSMFLNEYEENGLVVCQVNGKYIDPRSFSKKFARLLNKHNLKHIRFHDLRHSAATLMLSAGVQMKVASQILGHSSISITADLYQHVLSDMKKDAVNKVENILYPGDKNKD